VTQRVLPTGPWFAAMRKGDFDVVLEAPGYGIVNPLLDVQKVLPASFDSENYGQYEDPKAVHLYLRLLHETDLAKQRALMFDFEKYMLDTQAHMIWVLWWHRIVPYRSYMHGWKISPTHFLNQDLSDIWLAPPHCGRCASAPAPAATASMKKAGKE
jgi:peptide/nickel transport system substrate-binding protein